MGCAQTAWGLVADCAFSSILAVAQSEPREQCPDTDEGGGGGAEMGNKKKDRDRPRPGSVF